MTIPTQLYACIYAKELPLQAMLRLRPELRGRPCAVTQGEPPLRSVCSCNTSARRLGVVPGMTQVEIDTLPSVTVLHRSHAEEQTAKYALLECASAISPRIENRVEDRAFICVLDIAGTEKLFGTPPLLAKTLRERIAAIGIESSIAISGNFHAAICLARGSSSRMNATIVASGDEGAALAPLPLEVLNLSQQIAETFSLWGIRILGMLAALPEKALIARMGQEGKRLRQLARGELPHLLQPLEPAFALEENMQLDTPVELLDSLLFAVGVMLDQLITRATARILALSSVTITLKLEGDRTHARRVRPALPTNDRLLWIKLLHLDLEAHPPQAAILSLTLAAETGSPSKLQLGLFSPQLPEPMRLDVTMARIRAVVGEERVGSPILKDSHRPDDFRMSPFAVPTGSAKSLSPNRSIAAMRQLRPAEDVAVTLHAHRPISFFFREVRYTVERAYGPWLAGGEWWNQHRWRLQQWDLVARSHQGSTLCCCLVRDLSQNCWRMVRLYD